MELAVLANVYTKICQSVFPVRANTRYAEFVIFPISQPEDFLDPSNTRTVKVYEVVERIVLGRPIGDWRWVLSSTTDYIFMVSLRI
jgi:hypothetical protein